MAYKTERWFILALAVFENLIFGGIFYGWPAMMFVLKSYGYFSYLCQTQSSDSTVNSAEISVTCDEQDARLTLVFTIGVFCLQGTGLIGGFIYDRYGTRITRILINIFIFVGFLLLSVSSTETSWLLFPVAICLSVGGIEILITTLQIGNLFGNRKATVITAINGVFDSSTIVMFLIKLTYEEETNNFSIVRIIFYILTASTSIMLIQTFFLLPKGHIPWPLPPDYRPRKYKKLGAEEVIVNGNGVVAHGHTNGNLKADEPEEGTVGQNRIENTKQSDYPNLRSCVFSKTFLGLCIWSSLLGLRNSYFLGSFNMWATDLSKDNVTQPDVEQLDVETVSHFTNIFAGLQCTGILFAPFCGLIFDRNKKRRTGNVSPYADLKDGIAPLFIVCTIFTIFSIMVMVPILEFHYVTFIFQVVLRAFFYATFATIIGIIFPLSHFGTLYGLSGLIAATTALLQYPLILLAQNRVLEIAGNRRLAIDLAFMVVVLATYGFPLFVYMDVKRKEKQLKLEGKCTELTISN